MPTNSSDLMIRCIPKGICSYNFTLEGDGCHADLRLDWLLEQGTIEIDGQLFEVRKHGPLSGHWTLESAGRTAVSAQKSNIVTRTFELQDLTAKCTLRAVSAFGRSFRIEKSGEAVVAIKPDHPLTRRATIQTGVSPLACTTLAFAFWLVALMWRRGDST